MKRKNKFTNWIKVNLPKRNYFGEPVPVDEFCRAISAAARDLQLTDRDVSAITVQDCGLKDGYCRRWSDGAVEIALDECLEGHKIWITAAHELRHAWQIKHGLIPDIDRLSNVDWFSDESFDAYEALPHEIDARAYAEELYIKTHPTQETKQQ